MRGTTTLLLLPLLLLGSAAAEFPIDADKMLPQVLNVSIGDSVKWVSVNRRDTTVEGSLLK